MNVKELITYMTEHPWAIRQGAGKTAIRTHSKVNDVIEARNTILSSRGVSTRNRYNNIKKVPKVLLFDIETSPMKSYIWGLWKLNIHIDLVLNDWFIICWSAKWLYNNEVLGDCLTPTEITQEDDKRICTSLWKLLDEADIVVAHNGDRFDIPRIKSRFIINGLNPYKPVFSVDTCTVARKQFGFTSNKLDALTTYFGFEHKLDTDFLLWKSCMEGDLEALDYMLEYNKRDVTLLEEVYLKLRPWIKGHPNCGNFFDVSYPICSNCGSSTILKLDNQYYYTSVGQYQLYRCKCGCISRGRKNLRANKLNNTSIGK